MRRSSSATARDTLVLCIAECSPIAVAVIVPNCAERRQRPPFRARQAEAVAVDLREFAADRIGKPVEPVGQEVFEFEDFGFHEFRHPGSVSQD